MSKVTVIDLVVSIGSFELSAFLAKIRRLDLLTNNTFSFTVLVEPETKAHVWLC